MASRMEPFLSLVNERLFQNTKLTELKALWAEAHFYPTCTALVLKGERMGQPCGKACVKDQPVCMCHTPRPVKEQPVSRPKCETVAKQGTCNRYCVEGSKNCKFHQPKEETACPFVLVLGHRKGQTCGKSCAKDQAWCVRHVKK